MSESEKQPLYLARHKSGKVMELESAGAVAIFLWGRSISDWKIYRDVRLQSCEVRRIENELTAGETQ